VIEVGPCTPRSDQRLCAFASRWVIDAWPPDRQFVAPFSMTEDRRGKERLGARPHCATLMVALPFLSRRRAAALGGLRCCAAALDRG
jgi:hypothetical protein